MPKKLSKENIQSCTIKQLTDEYNADMKAAFGSDKAQIPAILEYFQYKSRTSFYRKFADVKPYGRKGLYRTIDLARSVVQSSIVGGGKS
jgi:hypothetical protein